jgi:Transposase DDE domain
MIHSVDPRQKRLFDPFQGVIPPAGQRIISEGWQGVFRHALLELMPVSDLSSHFSDLSGAPTKELYSMAGLVFLGDFFAWTAQQATEAYIFRSDVQYALNLEPGVEVSSRSIERYQRLFREDDLATRVFDDVTDRLVQLLELDVSRQRLDSTHVFSDMALFGRTKLMATAIKRFLTQLKRHAADAFNALPEDFRERYGPTQARLFADAKDPDARARLRQQAAEDLDFLISRFANCAEIANRSTFKTLVTIFNQQCERSKGKVVVKDKPGGDCLQNPSDPDATLDGHKGPGYQVQIAETCVPGNEVQLITGVIPQTACQSDGESVTPMLDQLHKAGRLPAELLADTSYGGDENVQSAEARRVDLVAPVAGRAPAGGNEVLTVDDFAVDERTGAVEACPTGHQPLSWSLDAQTATIHVEMPAAACQACAFRKQCPIARTREGRFVVEFTERERRLAGRRTEEQTDVFQERYAPRAGIESTNSGLKNRLRLGRLRVRGRGSVFRVIRHKLAGWNLLRAAVSKKVRAVVAQRIAEMYEPSRIGQLGRLQELHLPRIDCLRGLFSGRPTRTQCHQKLRAA